MQGIVHGIYAGKISGRQPKPSAKAVLSAIGDCEGADAAI